MCQPRSTPRGQCITWSSPSGATRKSQFHTAKPQPKALLRTRGELGHLTRPAGNVSQLRALVARGRLLLAGLGGAGGFPEYTQQSGKAAPFCEQALRYEARTFTTGWEADRQLSSHNLLEEGG